MTLPLAAEGAPTSAGACGCLGGLGALLGRGHTAPVASSAKHNEKFHKIIHDVVQSEIKTLEADLSQELQSVLSRLTADQRRRAKEEDSESLKAQEGSRDDDALVVRHNRADYKRRWTIAADGARELQIFSFGVEGKEAPDFSRQSSAELHGPKCVHFPSEEMLEEDVESEEAVKDEEGPLCPPSTPWPTSAPSTIPMDNEEVTTPSKAPQSVWRADALDFGDMWLAAAAAAKKGSASVDSIVELVQSERERWAVEKQELEERLQELKDKKQTLVARQYDDPEKEQLKQKLTELRQDIKAKSRFGAWVCERHMQESDDEETEQPKSTLKEDLRKKVGELEQELLLARRERRASRGSTSGSISPGVRINGQD